MLKAGFLALLAGAGVASLGFASDANTVFYGVNLGGWLVLESWIVPSLFSDNNVADGSGEWEFCAQLGKAKCAEVLAQHWSSWVQEGDIAQLAAAGITHVRIPVGYWIVDIQPEEPFVPGGWDALVNVLVILKEYGIQAVIDLHGAPGSQNGEDHSGRSSNGIHWNTPANINRTIYDLTLIAERALQVNANSSTLNVISGIEMLNEPKTTYLNGPITMATLFDFYSRAYTAIRGTGFTGDIWAHDGWGYDDPGWVGFLAPPAAYGVYIDTHIYHAFGGDRQQPTPWTNVAYTCKNDGPMIATHFSTDWTIVGEWSLAIGPGTPNTSVGVGWLAAFGSAQIQSYCPQCWNSTGKGEFFWNFKIETGYDEWNFLLGIQNGWFPSPKGPYPDRSTYDFDCTAFN